MGAPAVKTVTMNRVLVSLLSLLALPFHLWLSLIYRMMTSLRNEIKSLPKKEANSFIFVLFFFVFVFVLFFCPSAQSCTSAFNQDYAILDHPKLYIKSK